MAKFNRATEDLCVEALTEQLYVAVPLDLYVEYDANWSSCPTPLRV
jgi:hypothetical protein